MMPDSNNSSSPGHMTAGGYKKPVIIIAAGILLLICFHFKVSSRTGFIGYAGSHFYLQDYAYHVILTNHFWFKESGNIYDLDFQLEALSNYMGRPAPVTMPVGVTPIALIVWMPFAYIVNFSLPLAFSLWIAVSVGMLALALCTITAYLFAAKSHQALPVGLCLITVFSLVGASNILVGQTSIFAAGIFSLIIYRMIRVSRERETSSADWPVILLVVLAGLKPPYMVIGLGILLIYGRWRDLFYSATIVLLLTAMLTPMLTAGWLRSYINTLHMYASGNFPDIYAWSIDLNTMNIFRSAISDLTGDSVAAVSSIILNGFILLSIVMLSLFTPRRYITRGALIVSLIACCLLFAPYSGAYEDMLLIPVFVTVMLTGKTRPLSGFKSMIIAGALFFCLLHNFPGIPHNLLWIFFVLKFMVLVSMIHYAGGNEPGSPLEPYPPLGN